MLFVDFIENNDLADFDGEVWWHNSLIE